MSAREVPPIAPLPGETEPEYRLRVADAHEQLNRNASFRAFLEEAAEPTYPPEPEEPAMAEPLPAARAIPRPVRECSVELRYDDDGPHLVVGAGVDRRTLTNVAAFTLEEVAGTELPVLTVYGYRMTNPQDVRLRHARVREVDQLERQMERMSVQLAASQGRLERVVRELVLMVSLRPWSDLRGEEADRERARCVDAALGGEEAGLARLHQGTVGDALAATYRILEEARQYHDVQGVEEAVDWPDARDIRLELMQAVEQLHVLATRLMLERRQEGPLPAIPYVLEEMLPEPSARPPFPNMEDVVRDIVESGGDPSPLEARKQAEREGERILRRHIAGVQADIVLAGVPVHEGGDPAPRRHMTRDQVEREVGEPLELPANPTQYDDLATQRGRMPDMGDRVPVDERRTAEEAERNAEAMRALQPKLVPEVSVAEQEQKTAARVLGNRPPGGAQ